MKAEYFLDSLERTFVPYEGWLITQQDGTSIPDPMTCVDEGPLEIKCTMLSHGNFHNLYNIIKRNGDCILDRNVRKIEFYQEGYYVVEDNNEDELIAKHGYIPNSEWKLKYNIVSDKGLLLSDEWFDGVYEFANGFIRVVRDGKENLIDLKGILYLKSWADYVSFYNNEYVFSIYDGVLCKVFPDGKTANIRSLSSLQENENYIIGRWEFTNREDWIERSGLKMKLISVLPVYTKGCKYINLVDRNFYLLFNKWYINNRCEFVGKTGIQGLYIVNTDKSSQLVNANEELIIDAKYITRCKQGCLLVSIKGNICVIDFSGKTIIQGFTSALWTDKGLWSVNYLSGNESKCYLHGEGGEFISYTHEVLISKPNNVLLEKDDIWYYLDNDNHLQPLMKYRLKNGERI